MLLIGQPKDISGSKIDILNAWLFPAPGSAMHIVNKFTGSGYSYLSRTYALGPIKAATVPYWKCLVRRP